MLVKSNNLIWNGLVLQEKQQHIHIQFIEKMSLLYSSFNRLAFKLKLTVGGCQVVKLN